MEREFINREKEKTLRLAWLVSATAPLGTGFALYQSGSVTILADFLRRTMELMVLFSNWFIFKKILKQENEFTESRYRKYELERIATIGVALVLIISFFVILFNALRRFQNPQPIGTVWAGLVIGVLGFVINSLFWRKNKSLALIEESSIFYSQWKLYRAKALMDLSLVSILTLGKALEHYPNAEYIDPVGSLIMSSILLYSSYRVWFVKIKKTINS